MDGLPYFYTLRLRQFQKLWAETLKSAPVLNNPLTIFLEPESHNLMGSNLAPDPPWAEFNADPFSSFA